MGKIDQNHLIVKREFAVLKIFTQSFRQCFSGFYLKTWEEKWNDEDEGKEAMEPGGAGLM